LRYQPTPVLKSNYLSRGVSILRLDKKREFILRISFLILLLNALLFTQVVSAVDQEAKVRGALLKAIKTHDTEMVNAIASGGYESIDRDDVLQEKIYEYLDAERQRKIEAEKRAAAEAAAKKEAQEKARLDAIAAKKAAQEKAKQDAIAAEKKKKADALAKQNASAAAAAAVVAKKAADAKKKKEAAAAKKRADAKRKADQKAAAEKKKRDAAAQKKRREAAAAKKKKEQATAAKKAQAAKQKRKEAAAKKNAAPKKSVKKSTPPVKKTVPKKAAPKKVAAPKVVPKAAVVVPVAATTAEAAPVAVSNKKLIGTWKQVSSEKVITLKIEANTDFTLEQVEDDGTLTISGTWKSEENILMLSIKRVQRNVHTRDTDIHRIYKVERLSKHRLVLKDKRNRIAYDLKR